MIHCIKFLKYPCLNFNHVIINMNFHNVFAYYGRENHKEIKCQNKFPFLTSHDVMSEYIRVKSKCYNVLKKENVFKK